MAISLLTTPFSNESAGSKTASTIADGVVAIALIAIGISGLFFSSLSLSSAACYGMIGAGAGEAIGLLMVRLCYSNLLSQKGKSEKITAAGKKESSEKASPLPLTPAKQREKLLIHDENYFADMNGYSFIEETIAGKALRLQAADHLNGRQLLDETSNRSMGVMLGMATGDAIGAGFEFMVYKPEGYQLPGKKINMRANAITGAESNYLALSGLSPGQWTDDTSQGLCLADSLIQNRGIDGKQLMWAFLDWWHYGMNNAFTDPKHPHPSVGMGECVRQAFQQYLLTEPSREDRGEFSTLVGDSFTSGNGSLMRNGPVAIFARNLDEAMEFAWKQSKVTHQGDEAAACCQLMAFFLYHALHSKTQDVAQRKKELFEKLSQFRCQVGSVNGLAQSLENVANPKTVELNKQKAEKAKESPAPQEPQGSSTSETNQESELENWNWRSEQFAFNPTRVAILKGGYIGSYAMDALAMALHCVYTTNSYEEAVLKAISCGGDADTLGAITGQLAGSLYGARAIPMDWINAVQQWDRGGEIAARALLLNQVREKPPR